MIRGTPRFLRDIAVQALFVFASLDHANANTIIQTLRDGRVVSGVEVVVVKQVSGQAVGTRHSAVGGFAVFPDLKEGVRYEAQTSDGASFTQPFEAGATVRLETGRGGLAWAIEVSGVPAAANAQFTSDCATCLDVEKRKTAVYLDVDAMLVGSPVKMFVPGTRPFLTSGAEFAVDQPKRFADDNGSTANIEDQVGWKIGIGLSVPFDFGDYTLNVEPTLRYVLMRSKLVSKPVDDATERERFTTHAVEIGLGTELPIASMGPAQLSAAVGASAYIPVAGSAELDSTLKGKSGLGYRGRFGLRITLPSGAIVD